MNGSRYNSWQAEELDRVMTAQAGKRWPEQRCAPLSNPAAERELDAIVLKELWPGVEQALQDSSLVALTGGGASTPAQALETLHRKFTTRSLTFVIEDPERLAGPGARKPWFCRFEIVACIEGYITKKTTILSFPKDFTIAKLMRLLKETAGPRSRWTTIIGGGAPDAGLPADPELVRGLRRCGDVQRRAKRQPGLRLGPARAGRGAGARTEDGGRSSRGHRGQWTGSRRTGTTAQPSTNSIGWPLMPALPTEAIWMVFPLALTRSSAKRLPT
ncbi:MAG: hypothetical protein OXP75_03885 [Rhodospirillales bacterium]|nr:hypothetical protein [Rhodospirillales bacterium]